MGETTRSQMLALAELAQGSCWPAARTSPGWVQGRAAASLFEAGLASREWRGTAGVVSGLGKVGGAQYLYSVTDAGRRALMAEVDKRSAEFAWAALAVLHDGRHARRSLRMGHAAEVSCACGWPGKDRDGVEVRGQSGDDTARRARAEFARHVDEVVAAAIVRGRSRG